MVRQWRGQVSFAAVYIQEAHAKDEWPISESPRDFNQHQTIDDRLAAARTLVSDFYVAPEVAWYVDTMANEFNKAYASWPFRFWVLCPGSPHTIQFKPMPKEAMYDLDELRSHLHSHVGSPGAPI